MSNSFELAPTVAINDGPDVMSALMELSPEIADEIMELTLGIERYKNVRIRRERLLSLSLESENQATVLSRFIDSLIRFINKFIKDIVEGSATLGFSLSRIHNRAELINTESRSRARSTRNEEFKISTRIHNLCVNYRPVSDPQQLLMLLKSSDQIFKGYFKYQNSELPAIIPAIISLRPGDETSVIKLMDLLHSVSPVNKAKELNFNGDDSIKSSPHLFGNQRLHVINKNPNGNLLEQLTGQEWFIQVSSDNPKPLPSSITYKVFAHTLEQSILRQITSTVVDLESNFNLVSRNRRSSRVADLTKYLDYIRNNVINGTYNDDTLERANQMILLIESYSNWLINPYLNLMGLYIRNANAILNVCEANN